jgi:hypothetical protein
MTSSEKPEMDPLATAITAAAKSETSQSLIRAVLLPSAELYGQHLRDILDTRLSERRAANAQRILEKASRKLDPNQTGYWPPRVVKEIFDDGSLTDDGLAAEYLAGVLASSRSPNGRDDRGVAISTMINRLSFYTLRTHYIFYTAVRQLLAGSGLQLGVDVEAKKAQVYIPYSTYYSAMEFDRSEDAWGASTHAIYALAQDNLIGLDYWFGRLEFIRESFPSAPEVGMVITPSVRGVELYLWAAGKSRSSESSFLDPNEPFDFDVEVDIGSGYAIASELRKPMPGSDPPTG